MKAIVFTLVFLSCSTVLGANTEWSFSKGRQHRGFTEKNESPEDAVFDSSLSYEERWALVAQVTMKLTPPRRVKFLERCLRSSEWFLRSAALKTLAQLQHQNAIRWAIKLLNDDKSLIVRSDAVSVIGSLRAKVAVPYLWKALNAEQNFRDGKSLWIRPQIAKVLTRLSTSKQSNKWMGYLTDQDQVVRRVANGQVSGLSF